MFFLYHIGLSSSGAVTSFRYGICRGNIHGEEPTPKGPQPARPPRFTKNIDETFHIINVKIFRAVQNEVRVVWRVVVRAWCPFI